MATYNKRGYKTPKEKEEKGGNIDNNFIDDTTNIDEKDSTTAGVFSRLDEGASKTEEWVEKNQKVIFGVLGAIALFTVGYLLYNKFVAEPKEDESADAMFQAQQYYKQATDENDEKKSDSLYTLSLNGGEGKKGFVGLADQFSGTDAANIANYCAGIASYKTGKYAEAIKYLDQYNGADTMTKSLALGTIGDANSELGKTKEALEFYEKAAETNQNSMTTPRFLLKAGQTALTLGQKADALKHFTAIKEKYESTQEAQGIDALIGLAQ
jgi:tetratricopeptide (TPR) repeat protein